MMNAVLGRLSQSYCHVQRPDRQISLHTITDSPADDTPRIKIEDDGKIERMRRFGPIDLTGSWPVIGLG
jgi:hypothetical protein